jgi:hypothetical protein
MLEPGESSGTSVTSVPVTSSSEVIAGGVCCKDGPMTEVDELNDPKGTGVTTREEVKDRAIEADTGV